MREPERQRKRRRRPLERAERKKYLDSVKRAAICARCGFDDYRALDFHHRDPADKLFELVRGKAERRSWARLLAEVAKCDLLCANCHRIEHFENPVGYSLVPSLPMLGSQETLF